ncbi:MAG: T9SS type A sorting domain-containing protein [Bacteroidetes bacterium]|nr:T9SS type A sorting domain-containing protein [Bacteroidota bacterium]
MKTKILFISFVCCLVLQANAQTTNNAIVNDNSSWAVRIESVCGTANCPIETQYVYFDGDSIFNEKTYKKVFYYSDKQHTERFFTGLLREENKKTYYVPYHIGTETLVKEIVLYDFSLEEGMTFSPSEQTYLMEVKNSDMVEINGVLKKRLQLTYAPSSFYENILDTWIEGIGSLDGIISQNWFIGNGARRTLLCYYQNNELIYKNPAYSECYYNNSEDITSVQSITINDCNIFPNPVDDILHISCLNDIIVRTEIFDNAGRQVYNQAYKDTINVSSFSKGLYLLKLYDANAQVFEFKFIKK